jgi:hypothetical protein
MELWSLGSIIEIHFHSDSHEFWVASTLMPFTLNDCPPISQVYGEGCSTPTQTQ